MAGPEEERLSLELSSANFKAYGTRLDIRAANISMDRAASIAGQWATRQEYPSNVLKWDPDKEAISRFPGIGDRIAVHLGWRLSRCVGAFAVGTEYAGQIIDAARDTGHELSGIVIGRDRDADLYMVSPEGEAPTTAALRELVEATNKQLSEAGVVRLPMHSGLMFERV